MKRATKEFWVEISRLDQSLSEASYYDLLDVPADADSETISNAYRKRISILHPDRHALETAKRKKLLTRLFARVSEAYRVLGDGAKRRSYDLGLSQGHMRYQEGKPSDPGDGLPRSQQGRALFQEGSALLEQGQRKAALAKLQLAAQFDKDSRAIQDALARARGESHEPEVTSAPTSPRPIDTPLAHQKTVRAAPSPSSERPSQDAKAPLGRRHKRYPLGKLLKVRCSKWDQVKALYSQNISRGGMLLRSAEELAVGSVIEISIIVPSGETIELPAEVVRHVPPAQPGQRLGLGIRFISVPPECHEEFLRLIASAPELEKAEPAPGAAPMPVQSSLLGGAQGLITARAAIARGDFSEACRFLQPMLQAAPNDRHLRAAFHLAAGYLAKERGQADAARAHFERTLRYDPHSAEAVAELRKDDGQ